VRYFFCKMRTKTQYFTILFLFLLSFLGFSQLENPEKSSLSNEFIKNQISKASLLLHKCEFTKSLVIIQNIRKKLNPEQKKLFTLDLNRTLAEVHKEIGNLEKAKKEITTVVKAHRQAQNQKELTKSLILYSNILIELENDSLALKLLNESLDISLDINIEDKIKGEIYLNKGIVSLEQKNTKLATELFQQALVFINNSDQYYLKTKLLYHKAKLHFQSNNYENAKTALENSMKINSEMAYHKIQSQCYLLYSAIYEKEENTNKALELLQKHLNLNKTIYTIDREIVVQEAEAQLHLDDNTEIIEELTEENSKQQKSLQVGRLATILAIALITILSLLTLSLYKNNNLRARANELLQNKNAELITAKEKAERANAAKAQFLSTITHELRTPLYAVTGLTHLLLEESPTPNQKEHLNSLKFSGEYLLSLINNILDLNKLEANKVEVENTAFNLKKRINDVLIALNKTAKDRQNNLHFEFDSNIPAKIKGDPVKISQILINLIGNSIKFTENGDIWIRVQQIKDTKNKIFLNFEIEDNGVGISKKKQQIIFDNFIQGSVQINRKFGGTGLGLSIVKNLLSLMNSEIKLESELDKGSKFSFEIEFNTMEESTTNYEEAAKAIDYKELENKYVLVVEDNKINQLITRKILEKSNIKCDVADNGTIAIEKTQNDSFDLILMDIHMPGISGIEATKKIREFNTEIPILALTAVTLDDNLDEFYQHGFNDIIPKPFKTEEFFTKLHTALNNKKTS